MVATSKKLAKRVAILRQGEFQSREFFVENYELTQAGLDKMLPRVERWAARANRSAFMGQHVSRWAFERYYAHFELLSPRSAAARIGTDTSSLRRVVGYAKSLGVPPESIGEIGAGVRADFIDRLIRLFPPLANTIFGDHTQYCRTLHKALLEEHVKVEPAIDRSSKAVANQEKGEEEDCAYHYDIVTLEPLGLRFQVWLDFKKPMDLEPDKTSAATYLQNIALLEPFVPGYARPEPSMLARVKKALNA